MTKARKKFAENVRRLRRAKDMSQEDLAFKAEIDRTYVSGIERGIKNPSLDVMERIAKALDVKIEDLV